MLDRDRPIFQTGTGTGVDWSLLRARQRSAISACPTLDVLVRNTVFSSDSGTLSTRNRGWHHEPKAVTNQQTRSGTGRLVHKNNTVRTQYYFLIGQRCPEQAVFAGGITSQKP